MIKLKFSEQTQNKNTCTKQKSELSLLTHKIDKY